MVTMRRGLVPLEEEGEGEEDMVEMLGCKYGRFWRNGGFVKRSVGCL